MGFNSAFKGLTVGGLAIPRNQKCAGLMHMVANTSYITVAESSGTCYCPFVWIFLCIGVDIWYIY